MTRTRRGGARQRLSSIPLHPPIFALAFVVVNYVETGVHVAATGRALLVALAGAVILQGASIAMARDRHLGSTIATGALLLVIFWYPMVFALEAATRVPAWQAVTFALALVGFVVVASRLAAKAIRASGWQPATSALNVLAGCLAFVVIANFVTSPIFVTALGDLVHAGPASVQTTLANADRSRAPDIYVVIADGHPRRDSLLEQTGHDLTAFEDALEMAGFEIAPRAHSNYSWTGATLSTMFSMAPLSELDHRPEPITETSTGFQATRAAVNHGPAFSLLRELGYETIAIGPPYEHTALRTAVDRFIDAGYLNSFECHLIRHTALGAAGWTIGPRVVGDPRRSGVERSLSEAVTLAGQRTDRPRFVLVHLPAPHMPILWDAAGRPADDPFGSDCAPIGATGRDFDALERAYLESLTHLDNLIVNAVSGVIEASTSPPVVTVISDHGALLGRGVHEASGARLWRDSFGILFAAHTPGHPELFGDDPSLINLLPEIFNAYLGTELPLHPDDAFWLDGSRAERPGGS